MKIECPEGWKLAKLDDLGEVNRGRSRHRPRHAPHLYGGPYPFIQTGDIKASGGRISSYKQTYSEAGLAQSRLWPAGTMCITIAANIAETGILQFPACFPDSVIGFIGDQNKCDTHFVEYMFRHLKSLIQHAAGDGGTVQDNINLGTLDQLHFPVPIDVDEQRTIARILSALDDKIELNQQMNRTLEATAQAIFKSWFVDFDPVVAKAGGRQPFGIDAETAALFPNRFIESVVGPIPESWEIAIFSKAFEINPPRPLSLGRNASYLDMQAMPTDSALPSNWITRPAGSGMRFINGDTLVARITPCLENGKTAYVNFLQEQEVGWGSTEYIVLRSRPPLPLEFSYFFSRSDEFRAHAIINMTGSSGRQRVPVSCFDHYAVTIPTKPVLNKFGSLAGAALASMKENLEQSRTLAGLRDMLLPRLISGELRVKQAEQVVQEAV
jgi:type I restriction enzyme S subunit